MYFKQNGLKGVYAGFQAIAVAILFSIKFEGVLFEQVVAHFREVFCAVKQRGSVPKLPEHLKLLIWTQLVHGLVWREWPVWVNLSPAYRYILDYACLRPDWTVASKSGRDSSAYIAPTEPRTLSRQDPDLASATLSTRGVIIIHDDDAIWCLDTHQELQRLWLADTLRLSPPDSPRESAEIWADWDEIQSLVTRDLASGRADGKSGRSR